jgi:hypothetical protein
LTLSCIVCALAVGPVAAQQAPSAQKLPSGQEAEQGFVSLFDGQSLEGWQAPAQGYVVENGVLVCQANAEKLFTKKEYANFIFRFEFKLGPGGNNGIGIRAPLEGQTSREGIEIQILDDDAPQYATLGPYQYHGSIYGMVPAQRGHLKPTGQWNAEEIACDGTRIKITLNDAVIVDADLKDVTDPTPDGYPHPGRHREKGFLALLGHHSRVEFRNIRIKEL